MGARLVFITQRVDPDDPVLGATVAKIEALAARCDEVVVLADSVVAGVLPRNCNVRLFAARTRLGRGIRFASALAVELVRQPRPLAIVAHMCPVYAVLAAPFARPLGVRILLWYTQWSRTRTLALAGRLANAVLSVDRRSVPLGAKAYGIGHGIDVDQFRCSSRTPRSTLHAVALGRYSDSKGLPAILRGVAAARAAGLDVRLRCSGPTITHAERAHLVSLRRLVEELGMDGAVELDGPLPRSDVPELLGGVDVLVNNTRTGAADKVVYEACASCCPVLVSNPVFDDVLGEVEPSLRFEEDDPQGLAAGLGRIAALNREERAELGRELRRRVAERHSVASWADAVLRHAHGEGET